MTKRELVYAIIGAVVTISGAWIAEIAPKNAEILDLEQNQNIFNDKLISMNNKIVMLENIKLPNQIASSNVEKNKEGSSFVILGTKHKKNKSTGRYFGFNAHDLDKILQRSDWGSNVIFVSTALDGPYKPAILWRRVGVEGGDSHGRLVNDSPNDWSIGQSVFVQRDPKLVLPSK